MSPLNCCLSARVNSKVDEWLIVQTDVRHFWVSRMRLYLCPSCSQLWRWRAELVGHQEWDLTWTKCASKDEFEATCVAQVAEDERRQTEQKQVYEQNGLEWPSGLKKRLV